MNAAIRRPREAGRSGSKRTDGRSRLAAHASLDDASLPQRSPKRSRLTGGTVEPAMRVSAAALVAFTCSICLALGLRGVRRRARRLGRAHRGPRSPRPRSRSRREEKQVWAPLPPDRSAIPVLLYHGIGPESDFSNAADASYGVGTEDFAKQMTMIAARRLRDDRPADVRRLRAGRARSSFPRGRCCSPSTTRAPTPGPAATGSCASWASTRSCSSTSAASTAATRST